MLLQSRLNLYLHQFNFKSLGLSLDVNIYSSFIQLRETEDFSINFESDSGMNSTPAHVTPEEDALSLLVRQQIEKFKASFLDKGSSADDISSLTFGSSRVKQLSSVKVDEIQSTGGPLNIPLMSDYGVETKLLKS